VTINPAQLISRISMKLCLYVALRVGKAEGEFRFRVELDLGLGSQFRWGATVAKVSVRGASVMESI